jgi:hypothetical protein
VRLEPFPERHRSYVLPASLWLCLSWTAQASAFGPGGTAGSLEDPGPQLAGVEVCSALDLVEVGSEKLLLKASAGVVDRAGRGSFMVSEGLTKAVSAREGALPAGRNDTPCKTAGGRPLAACEPAASPLTATPTGVGGGDERPGSAYRRPRTHSRFGSVPPLSIHVGVPLAR